MSEKYSVLMSLYIKEKPSNFKESMDSILSQTILPEQIVVVEDGPLSPGLKDLVNFYLSQYGNQITNVKLKKNVGLGLALNEGIKVCRNELIARMDTDDIALPNRCELQLKRFSDVDNLVILGTQIMEFDNDYSKPIYQRRVPCNYEDILKFARHRSPFNHPTVMYKKSYVEKIGCYNDLYRNQDYDLFYRMLKENYYAENLEESLLLFRTDEDNYKRRKSWIDCKGYIDLSYKMLKERYINIFDFIYVVISQLLFFLMPLSVVRIISQRLLREKLEN